MSIPEDISTGRELTIIIEDDLYILEDLFSVNDSSDIISTKRGIPLTIDDYTVVSIPERERYLPPHLVDSENTLNLYSNTPTPPERSLVIHRDTPFPSGRPSPIYRNPPIKRNNPMPPNPTGRPRMKLIEPIVPQPTLSIWKRFFEDLCCLLCQCYYACFQRHSDKVHDLEACKMRYSDSDSII